MRAVPGSAREAGTASRVALAPLRHTTLETWGLCLAIRGVACWLFSDATYLLPSILFVLGGGGDVRLVNRANESFGSVAQLLMLLGTGVVAFGAIVLIAGFITDGRGPQPK